VILALLLCLTAQDTVPAGFGTLRRDDIVARFSTGTLEIQVLPLDEQVIRLLAPTPTARSPSSCAAAPRTSRRAGRGGGGGAGGAGARRRIRRW